MKKLLLFITVLFLGISTINAQDASYGYEAGDWLLGGGVTFGSMDMGGVETKMNTIAPQVGYFLSENSALGLNLGLMSTDVDGTKVSNTDFGLAYYNFFMDLGEKTKLWWAAGFGTSSGDSFPDAQTRLGAGIGMNYFMSENIIVNFQLANILQYVKQGDDSSMTFGWDGEIANMSATPTLSIFFKL